MKSMVLARQLINPWTAATTLESTAREVFLEVLSECVDGPRIEFRTPAGRFRVPRGDGPVDCVVLVHSDETFLRALRYGNLGFGEAYMDELFDLEGDRFALSRLLEIMIRGKVRERLKSDPALAFKVLTIQGLNALRGDALNVQRHYDIGDDLFEAFLDDTMTYSCGYATNWDEELETLQRQKLDRICKKLELSSGDRLLDIGCGFAGMLIHAARHFNVKEAVGITLSRRHQALGQQRVNAAGLGDRIKIEYRSHRDVGSRELTGFHKVVSVGMAEHLARKEYGRYFRNIERALMPDGLALVHAIACNGPRNRHDPFIQRYIFPGSGQPRLSEMTRELEKNQMGVLDVENIVRHYAVTCQRWLEKFEENWPGLDHSKYPERFKRMWTYYLSSGIAAAKASDSAVFQVLFTKDCGREMRFQRV